MAERDDAAERLVRLEEGYRRAADDILALRKFKHDHMVPLPQTVASLIGAMENLEALSSRLDERVRVLENDKIHVRSTLSLFDWAFRNWPGVVGFLVLVYLMLQSSGRVP